MRSWPRRLLTPDRIDPAGAFDSLGVDSLMSLEIKNRLEGSLGLTLSATLLWRYPTIGSLAGYLAGQLAPPEEAEPAQSPTQPTPEAGAAAASDAAGEAEGLDSPAAAGSDLDDLLASIEDLDEDAAQALLSRRADRPAAGRP